MLTSPPTLSVGDVPGHMALALALTDATVHGMEAFIGHAQGFAQAFPDSRLEVHALIEAGDRVVVEGAYTGTHTGPLASPQGTIPATALPYCEMFEVSAGRIVSKHVYYDQMTFAAQLGLLPEPAPAS
jgi:predicted ester cyclase